MDIIKSFSFNQHEILQNIVDLHTGPIECDVTYGNGCFYKKLSQPPFCFDLEPRPEHPHVRQADVCHLPLENAIVRTVMFDPPFMVTTGPGAKLKDRFGLIGKSVKELWQFYFLALHEIHRVLKPRGWLVMKCQDVVNSGVNNFSHCVIWQQALSLGFAPKDLFVLGAKVRMTSKQQKRQVHARKFHSFFWVFRKNGGRYLHGRRRKEN